MPATNVNLQIKGQSKSTTWRQDSCRTDFTNSSFNDLVVWQNLYVARTTTKTPGFRHRTSSTPLPFNAFSFEKKNWVNVGGVEYSRANTGIFSSLCGYKYDYARRSGQGVGYCPNISDMYNAPVSPLSSLEIASIDHDANNKVLMQCKEMHVNLAQFYAEREQAVRMFGETAERLAKAFKALRKGNVVAAAEHLGLPVGTRRQRQRILRRHKSRGRTAAETAASRWLELQYGWKPLLADVVGAAEAAAKALNAITYYEAKGRSSRKLGPSQPYRREHAVDASFGGISDGIVTVEGRHEVYYHLRFVPDTSMRAAVELGLTNPLELAWELLPYSFVADWFADVGQSLSALDATVGLTFTSGHKTEFFSWHFESMGTKVGKFAGGTEYLTPATRRDTFVWVKCTRSVLTTFPSAQFPMIKDLGRAMSGLHIANALALLTNSFIK